MEAVPRMPMICLDLKKAGDFNISHSVREVRLKDDQRLLKVLASNVNPFGVCLSPA